MRRGGALLKAKGSFAALRMTRRSRCHTRALRVVRAVGRPHLRSSRRSAPRAVWHLATFGTLRCSALRAVTHFTLSRFPPSACPGHRLRQRQRRRRREIFSRHRNTRGPRLRGDAFHRFPLGKKCWVVPDPGRHQPIHHAHAALNTALSTSLPKARIISISRSRPRCRRRRSTSAGIAGRARQGDWRHRLRAR